MEQINQQERRGRGGRMSGWAGGLAGGWPTAVWRQSGEVNLANLAISPVVPKQMEKAHAATKQRQHLRQRINNHTCGNESRTVLVATEQIKIPHAATKQRKHQRCRNKQRKRLRQLAPHASTCKSGRPRETNKREETQLAIDRTH